MNERDQHGPHGSADSTSTTPRQGSTDESKAIAAWAHRQAPHLAEVSNSNPNATWRRHNLAAITDDLEVARAVALDFERAADGDTDTTMVVLGHPVDREDSDQVDPEGVTSHAARRIMTGGLPGAAICAAIIGLGVWFVTESAAATAGAAIGGAIFGFFVTAVWSFVIGTGQSQAYQEGFVDPEAADAIFVTLTVDDRATVETARQAVAGETRARVFDIDEAGRPIA